MLSILKNAGVGSITYYVGDNPEHLKHLKGCKLFCKKLFEGLDDVEQIIVEDPQLEFYKLSQIVKDTYLFGSEAGYEVGDNTNIHKTAVIGDGVKIGNNVTIGPNTVIYSNTKIGNDVTIDANCTIGTEGMMWVWEGNKKVYLKQLGGVIIEDGVRICSGCTIVRGSANEFTIIGEGSNLAPNCAIGHGTYIGKHVHFANTITTGGSSYIADYNFAGCGVTIRPGAQITANDVILGTGCVVVSNIDESGVYIGTPAKKIKESKGKLSGMPSWRK